MPVKTYEFQPVRAWRGPGVGSYTRSMSLQELIPVAQEHWHPLIVHFPIALWTLGTLAYLASLTPYFYWLRTSSLVMGALGTGAGWAAAKTGEIAANSVASSLCNKALLAEHAEHAETTLIVFSVTWGVLVLLEVLRGRFAPDRELPVLLRALISAGLLFGSVYLVSTGHKGFRLVFEEGAGVRASNTGCVSETGAR